MKKSKLVLSEEAMNVLFHAVNSGGGTILHALKIGMRLASPSRELFGNHGLHMEILNGLINTEEFEDGESDETN